MSQPTVQEFSKLRSFFWPIHGHEVRKFLPMGLMMFFILFNYTILRNSKDALVISAGGASVVPFLKGYVVLPASILFVILYTKLVDLFSKQTVFYSIISFFVIFYGLFALVIYPNKELFHPTPEFVDALKDSYPTLKHFISIFATWSYSLFYVLAELWGSSVLSLLFWQFANEITKTTEAKRFYGMFGMLANFSLILAGLCGKLFYRVSHYLSSDGDSWGYALLMIGTAVMLAGFGTMWCYRWINSNVLTDPNLTPEKKAPAPKKKKVKMSVGQSFKFLLTSKYLGMITILVLCYGISINLVELLWKNQVHRQFPLPNDYNNFMGNLSIFTGIFTILTIMFTKGIVQKFGWLKGAIITPIMILVTGLLFFGFVFFAELMDPVAVLLGSTSLMMAVWLGLVQNVMSKGVKYGLFDPTKEMAYIPLDEDSKTKGKAAVDVIGARLGKASGGYVSSVLMMVTAGTILDIAPTLAVVVILSIALWIFAVVTLNKLYHEKLVETGEGGAA